jgi:hypothetical protein
MVKVLKLAWSKETEKNGTVCPWDFAEEQPVANDLPM